MRRSGIVLAVVVGCAAGVQGQINVTNNTNPQVLADTLVSGFAQGLLTVTNVSLQAHTFGNAASSGVYTVAGPNSYNLSPGGGIVLSSGNAADYGSGPDTINGMTTDYGQPASADDEFLLDQITGGTFDHFDVTRIDITFDAHDINEIAFRVVFGSEEWPDYVNDIFIDGFGIFLNGTNIAFAGGQPININHPDMSPIAGTELNAVLAPGGNPLMLFTGAVTPNSTGNVLTFIVGDTSDQILDTTVYVEGLVPAPGAFALLGLAGLAAARRRRP